jgi:hypothetical protein
LGDSTPLVTGRAVAATKEEIPNNKSQISNKRQFPNSKQGGASEADAVWRFEFR